MNARKRNPVLLVSVAVILLVFAMLLSRFVPLDQPTLRLRTTDGGADVESAMVDGGVVADAAKATGASIVKDTFRHPRLSRAKHQ